MIEWFIRKPIPKYQRKIGMIIMTIGCILVWFPFANIVYYLTMIALALVIFRIEQLHFFYDGIIDKEGNVLNHSQYSFVNLMNGVLLIFFIIDIIALIFILLYKGGILS